jgi:hypothetical protein
MNAGYARHLNSQVYLKNQLKPHVSALSNLGLPMSKAETAAIEALPERLGSLKQFKILHCMPKAARHSIAESLLEVLGNCTAHNDEASWSLLLTFSYQPF